MSRHAPHLTSGVAALTALAGLVAVGPGAGATGETCNGQAATIVGDGTITGTAGRDVIVGSPGDDSIDARGGNDLVCSGDGGDTVLDGPGKDIVFLGAGDDAAVADPVKDIGDVVHGDAGSDTASYALRVPTVKVTLAASGVSDDGAAGEADRLIDVENAVGGQGNDTLVGTDGANVLEGGGGNDTISDLAEADVVRGGPGNDKVAQPNTIDPSDDLDGGPGTDEISYAARKANQGTIALHLGSTSADNGTTIVGGEHDLVVGFENARGGQGTNDIDGTDGPNVIVMGAGGGHVTAFGGDDTITGGAGGETVDDGLGADVVKLGDGCDRVLQTVFSAHDVLDGGGGRFGCDYIFYDQRTNGVTINLDPLTTGASNGEAGEGDVLKGFERAYGGTGDDVIRGNGQKNLLYAGPSVYPPSDDGSDRLYGLGGDDWLEALDGVRGNDLVSGGAGKDYAAADYGDHFDTVEN